PEPTVESAHHSDQRGVFPGKAMDIFVMREHGKLPQMIVGLLEIEQTAEHRLPAAAIEKIARFYFRLRLVRRFDVDLHLIVSELELCHFRFFANLGAVFARMIEQKFVELRARHLISAIALRTKAVLEIKLYSFR